MVQEDLDIIALLTRSGTYVLGVAIFVVVYLVRKTAETAFPRWKKQSDANHPSPTYLSTWSRWWNEIVLSFLPVGLGVASGLIKSEFFFAGIGDKGGRLIFGACIGWFSSFLYKLLRRVIKQKMGVDITPGEGNSESERPPGG